MEGRLPRPPVRTGRGRKEEKYIVLRKTCGDKERDEHLSPWDRGEDK